MAYQRPHAVAREQDPGARRANHDQGAADVDPDAVVGPDVHTIFDGQGHTRGHRDGADDDVRVVRDTRSGCSRWCRSRRRSPARRDAAVDAEVAMAGRRVGDRRMRLVRLSSEIPGAMSALCLRELLQEIVRRFAAPF